MKHYETFKYRYNMIVAFDAKRAFFNNTGLGNYSRNTLTQLFQFYPQHQYWLYATSVRPRIKFNIPANARVITPNSLTGKLFQSYWRSFLINNQLLQDKPDIYHGLSNELPFGITSTKVKTVVTIHDLIFKRHPQWYKAVDAKIYDKKFKYAATYADVVIAVSKQTAKDIVEFYNVNPDKIKVVYQSCNPVFFNLLSPETVEQIKTKEKLPSTYLLYVGTIEERKNLHNLVSALAINNTEIPLVVIGRKTEYYFKTVEPLIQKYNLANKIHFIENIDNKELPGIYQGAKLFIYPSLYEGFGIPILESLASGTPVITSAGGCFPESAGSTSVLVDTKNPEALAHAISELLADKEKRITMIEEGRKYARLFTDKSSVENLMKIYEQLI